MYANLKPRPLVVVTGSVRYAFGPGGYHAENVELDSYLATGELSSVAESWPTTHPEFAEAVRSILFDNALGEDVEHTHEDIASIDHADHGRTRVYPRTTATVLQVNTAVGANTFGNWTVLIPVDTIGMPYHVVGVRPETFNAAGTFMIQFAKAAVPVADDILGELRFWYGALGNWMQFDPLPIMASHCEANEGVWARAMSDAGGNWMRTSLVISRHMELNHPDVANWSPWPWS